MTLRNMAVSVNMNSEIRSPRVYIVTISSHMLTLYRRATVTIHMTSGTNAANTNPVSMIIPRGDGPATIGGPSGALNTRLADLAEPLH